MKIQITRKRDNGEDDYLILPEAGDTVCFSGGWHNVQGDDYPFIKIESFICAAGYRANATHLSESIAKKINRDFCGMRDCCCGSGLDYNFCGDGTVLTYAEPDELEDILEDCEALE